MASNACPEFIVIYTLAQWKIGPLRVRKTEHQTVNIRLSRLGPGHSERPRMEARKAEVEDYSPASTFRKFIAQ